MKAGIIILLILLPLGSKAQNAVMPANYDSKDAEIQFQNDREHNTLSIYTLGGFYRGDHENDVAFQKEYALTYHSFGCTAPPNLNYYEAYNLLVFKYLEDMYGSVWEEKIRQDAMALTKWKERE